MPEISVAVLDVGHGNCAVVTDTHGVTIIDTGSGPTLLEFLVEEGIRKISTVLISHADKDHIAGLIGLLSANEVSIEQVYLNTDSLKRTKLWLTLTKSLELARRNRGVNFQVGLTSSTPADFSRGSVKIEILGPTPLVAARGPGSVDGEGRRLTTNSISAVIRLSREGSGVMVLPGDIDIVGLRNLDTVGADCTASFLVFPHHGGKSGEADDEAFAKEVCNTFKPETVIFSIGRGLHDTPRPEVINGVRATSATIGVMCTQLSNHCAKTLPVDQPTHLASRVARGRLTRQCCAGTILLELSTPTERRLPLLEAHTTFVRKTAPDALCQKPRV